MTSQFIPVEPFDYVVFGATGDLTRRIDALRQREIGSGQGEDGIVSFRVPHKTAIRTFFIEAASVT